MVEKESAVIPYDIDPSLHTSQPEPPQLDDGFSPPADELHAPEDEAAAVPPVDPALWAKSAF
jgi:hypothetical protein